MAAKNKASKQTTKPSTEPVKPPAASESSIVEATASYEDWLGCQTAVVAADIAFKHRQMAVSPFIFLRATFYRFAELWDKLAGQAREAPVILTVGDLHIENFGTWRDAEGRLIWGVNDFDETCYAPFTVDLVRVAASAILAGEERHLLITPTQICDEILDGYKDSVKSGGRAFVLAEDHAWLRDIAIASLKKPSDYWAHLTSLPKQTSQPPVSATECMERLMPQRGLNYELVHRVAGEGSLGRPRYTGVVPWHGGLVARDVKAMLPSAWQWARSHSGPYEILYAVAVGRAVRCHDPLVHSTGQWIGRRIAPDCSRIELVNLRAEHEEAKLLGSMGWETANIHLGTPGADKQIKAFLKQTKSNWLSEAASSFVAAIKRDYADWNQHMENTTRPPAGSGSSGTIVADAGL